VYNSRREIGYSVSANLKWSVKDLEIRAEASQDA